MSAFVYFFKLIYPFKLANKPNSKFAAAAGGYILVETAALRNIGGMQATQNKLIDDCALAQTLKQAGYKTWLGLTHGVLSRRPFVDLVEIWDMVTRTAFTELFYSTALLFPFTLIMFLKYCLPFAGIVLFNETSFWVSLSAISLMLAVYLPKLNFYCFQRSWAFTMPILATLYFLMTWTSALRYWRGGRSRWKGRIYKKN